MTFIFQLIFTDLSLIFMELMDINYYLKVRFMELVNINYLTVNPGLDSLQCLKMASSLEQLVVIVIVVK